MNFKHTNILTNNQLAKITSQDLKQKSEIITSSKIIVIYRVMKSPTLDVIINKSLMYAIQRSADKLESVVKLMGPEKVIPNYQRYLNDIRKLNEKLSGGKTIETDRDRWSGLNYIYIYSSLKLKIN